MKNNKKENNNSTSAVSVCPRQLADFLAHALSTSIVVSVRYVAENEDSLNFSKDAKEVSYTLYLGCLVLGSKLNGAVYKFHQKSQLISFEHIEVPISELVDSDPIEVFEKHKEDENHV